MTTPKTALPSPATPADRARKHSRLVGVARLLLPVLALLVVLPSTASAYLYWSSGGAIDRSNLDGTGLVEGLLPVSSLPWRANSIAVSDTDLYLAGSGSGGMIGRADLNGGDAIPAFIRIPQPVAEPGMPQNEANAHALAVGGDYLYWATGQGLIPSQHPNDAIGRARLDGTGIEPGLIKLETEAWAISVYGRYIYWITQHAIGRANLDGSGVEPEFIPLHGLGDGGLAVAEGYIYWSAEHAIGRSRLNGRHIETHLVTGLLSASIPIAVGGRNLYWRTGESQEEKATSRQLRSWIGRAMTDGRDIHQHFLSIPYGGSALVTDERGPGAVHLHKHRPTQHR